MKLTEKQKAHGKWQRSFTHDKVSRCAWLTNNDKRLLNAILDRRHKSHTSKCEPDCEPGWARIPMKELKQMTNLGQTKLKETIERLAKRGIVDRKSDGLYAGRDGATRYRIIYLPPYDPGPSSHAEESPEVESTAVASVGPSSDKEPAHKQIVELHSGSELPHPSQPAKPQPDTK